jgi:hypothetical protein
MCIPAETIRPHLNLTCNLQVAGNEKRAIRGAQGGIPYLFSCCDCPGLAFVVQSLLRCWLIGAQFDKGYHLTYLNCVVFASYCKGIQEKT